MADACCSRKTQIVLLAQSHRPRAECAYAKLQSLLKECKRMLLRAFLLVYPYASSLWEAAGFVYQLLYLLDASPFYSPMHHVLKQQIVRVSAHELVRSIVCSFSPICSQLLLCINAVTHVLVKIENKLSS